MKRRIKLRNKKNLNYGKLSKVNILILLIMLVIVSLFFAFLFIGRRVNPVVMNIAEREARKLAVLTISNSITSELSERLDFDSLFITSKDNDGNIQTMDYNSVVANQVLASSVARIHKNLKYIGTGEIEKLDFGDSVLVDYEKDSLRKGIFYEVPLGAIFQNTFLINLGPRIPVRFNLIGDTIGILHSKVTPYGINNALIEVTMQLTLNMRVVIPFSTKELVVEQYIPFSFKIVQGIVPRFFASGNNQNSPSFAFPVE